jgi:hypothetical protein
MRTLPCSNPCSPMAVFREGLDVASTSIVSTVLGTTCLVHCPVQVSDQRFAMPPWQLVWGEAGGEEERGITPPPRRRKWDHTSTEKSEQARSSTLIRPASAPHRSQSALSDERDTLPFPLPSLPSTAAAIGVYCASSQDSCSMRPHPGHDCHCLFN